MEANSKQSKGNEAQSNIHSPVENKNGLFSHFQGGISDDHPADKKDKEETGGYRSSFQTKSESANKSQGGFGEVAEDDFLAGHGRKAGEAMGDAGRVVGTGIGNAFGDVVGALTGINIDSTTVGAKTWSPNGGFKWSVGFKTSGKKAKNGWIIQRIKNTYRAQKTDGTAVAAGVPAKKYWEAWAVDAAGKVSPDRGGANDFWQRANVGPNTKGHWSMTGKVYFTKTDPATMGFVANSVPNAGILLATYTKPHDLGVARLHRYAQGTWDTKVHKGSAH
jgi:hypothetical protein